MTLLLFLGGCDDTTFHGAASDPVEGVGWEAVETLLARDCVACHDPDVLAGGMDLATDPCAALVGVPSTGYAPALRVAPGEQEASVLWHKLAATGDYGGEMPPGTGTAPENAAMVAAWIDDGAACGDAR